MKENRIMLKIGVTLAMIMLAAAAVIYFWPHGKLSTELNIYNWEEYLSPEVVADFEKKYGVKINIYYYDDEFTMLHELENNPDTDQYDLVVAGDSIMGKLIEENLLAPIEEKNIPNLSNIGNEFKDTVFNAKKFYAVPYNWGTTGLVINKKYIPEADSWDVLWNPDYAGRVCMLNDPAEVIGAAAKYLGLPLVPQSAEQMKKIEQALLEQKKICCGYIEDTSVSNKLLAGEIWASLQWNGTAASDIAKNSDLIYVIPKEGAAAWMDMWAIPKNAKNKYTAEKFLDYLNRPEVNAKNVSYVYYASCNEAAKQYIDKDILNNEIIYPPQSVMNRLDSYTDYTVDDEIYKMRDELWGELNK